MKPGPVGTPAEILSRLAGEHDVSLASLSQGLLRRNVGYLSHFVRAGQAARLADEDRKLLGIYFSVPEWWFGDRGV